MGARNVKMSTIAELAGVSVMTVSRVLSKKNNYSDATRDRVEKIARSLGYFPNMLGRSLIKDRLNVVGIVVPNIIHAFFPKVVNAVEERLAEAGFNTFLCCSRDDPEVEAEKIRTLLGHRVAGIIMLPSLRSEKSKASAEFALQNGCPLVLVDRMIPSVAADSVGWETAPAMDEIVGHLAERGCKNFVYCAGVREEWISRGRTAGFFAALKRRGLACKAEIDCAPTDEAVGAKIAKLVESGTKFDAVCCATDIHALSALLALKRLKIDVPKKVALTGFGAVANSHNTKLSITTVRQDEALMGKIAAEAIIERIAERDAKLPSAPFKKIKIPVDVEYGQSSLFAE